MIQKREYIGFLPFIQTKHTPQSSVVDPDPHPHHFGNLDPHPHQIKVRIRICIKVISWIQNRTRINFRQQANLEYEPI
jgi:hypothetical protein